MKLLNIALISALLLSSLWGYLPSSIERYISKTNIPYSSISILIGETKSGRIIANYNSDRLRRPASVIKLLTTYSALLELGKNFRWPTRFFISGYITRGVLYGDLVVKAYGDPTLSCQDIPNIIARLKRLGIKKITGNIVIDRSFFKVDNRISSGFDNRKYSEYNAMPDTMMFDDHLCRIDIETHSGKAVVKKSIPDKSYSVINNIKVTSKSCRGRYSWPRVSIKEKEGVPVVFLSGTLSSRCSTRRIKSLISHPYYAFYFALIDGMHYGDIEFNGKMKLAKVPKFARPLMTHYSKPLIKIIAKTNKKSNNLYARHIFLLVGAKVYGAPATLQKSRSAVNSILKKRGIIREKIIIDNGCGLSRKARLNAKTLYRLLQDAYHTYAWDWLGALSIAGVDGTIRKRFRRSIVKRHAWMKTGTLKDAKNIAGYVKGRSGKLYTVVILYNGVEKWKGKMLQDQIITWLVRKK